MSISHVASSRDTAQTHCAAYGLLAHAFRYPDEDMIEGLLKPARWSWWPTALRLFDAPAAEKLGAVSTWLESNRRRALATSSVLRDAYAVLYGHAVRGTCPPYELEYARGEIIQQASELADISGFYHAFGMELTGVAPERADHVAVQCEFMSVLCAKEAQALESDDSDAAETCSDAERTFLRDHLAQWLPAFCRRVTDADPDGFFGRLAQFALTFIQGESRRFEIGVGPQWIELRDADPALDATIDCEAQSTCDRAIAARPVQLTIGGSAAQEL